MTQEDLITAIDQANKILNAIMVIYPDLMPDISRPDVKKAYLVFSTPYGQCGITDNPLQILKELPSMISDSDFKEDTFIEIRFEWPVLDLIFKMQKDPLVSQVHTPQTRASIRIVLGTLRELAQRAENVGANKDEQKQL
jgi:hypothetical protein